MNVFNIRIGLGKVLLIFSNEVNRVGIGISGIDWFTNLWQETFAKGLFPISCFQFKATAHYWFALSKRCYEIMSGSN